MTDPLILGFDTSRAHCSAALLRGQTCVAARHEDMAKGQVERLMPLLEEVLAEAGIGWRDLTALGVGIGPGNFTGIRISVSAARGLALGLGIPAIGVSSFEALALGAEPPFLAMVSTARQQVFAQTVTAEGAEAPELIPLDTLEAIRAGHGSRWIGDHADEAEQILGGTVLTPAYPLAEAIARVALARRDADNPPPAPLYLRPADAAPPRDAPPVILD